MEFFKGKCAELTLADSVSSAFFTQINFREWLNVIPKRILKNIHSQKFQ